MDRLSSKYLPLPDLQKQVESNKRTEPPRSTNLNIIKNFTNLEKESFLRESFEFIMQYFDSHLFLSRHTFLIQCPNTTSIPCFLNVPILVRILPISDLYFFVSILIWYYSYKFKNFLCDVVWDAYL